LTLCSMRFPSAKGTHVLRTHTLLEHPPIFKPLSAQ
jgi:hypothetical protein